MKKKGLIIATIVMVLVLSVSLTTATYAWFSAEAQASVTDIPVSVGTSSNVVIGIKDSASHDYSSPAYFVNGDITYTENTAGKLDGTFTGTNAGLGMLVNTGATLFSLGGVFTAAATTENSAFDGSYNGSHFYCNGTIDTSPTVGKVTGAATVNQDADNNGTLLYAPFGVRAAQTDLTYMWCDITFKTTALYWGIATSTRLHITTADKTYNNRPFEQLSPAKNWDSSTGYSSQAITQTFRIMLVNNSAITAGDSGTIYKCEIIAFLDGTSNNCVQGATQYASTMTIAFDASATAPDNTGITVLSLSNI